MRIHLFAAAAALAFSTATHAEVDPKIAARVEKVLKATPLIDGHNDLAEQIRGRFDGRLDRVDLRADLSQVKQNGVPMMTDIPRLKAGHLGGQFWSVFIPPSITGPPAVQATLEQIDIVKGLTAKYPDVFEMAYTADDVVRIHKAGRLA